MGLGKKTLLQVSIILAAILLCSVVGIPESSAQAAPTYRLGVSRGDSATYNVDELNTSTLNMRLGFRQGDRIKVRLNDINVVTIIDKTNSDILSFEVSRSIAYVNDVQSDIIWELEYLLWVLRDVPYYILGVLFYPYEGDFWSALARYFPSLQVSRSGNQLKIVSGSFFHYRLQVGNATFEDYRGNLAKIDVDAVTGIASRIECREISNGVNMYSIVMTLVSSSISSFTAQDQLVYICIAAPIILTVSTLLMSRLHLRRRIKGTRKGEILRRLSSEELLRLAETIPRAQVVAGTSKAALVKMIGESLSVKEIKSKLSE